MKRQARSRLVAIFLSAIMSAACLPLTVLAAEPAGDSSERLYFSRADNRKGWVIGDTAGELQFKSTTGEVVTELAAGTEYRLYDPGDLSGSGSDTYMNPFDLEGDTVTGDTRTDTRAGTVKLAEGENGGYFIQYTMDGTVLNLTDRTKIRERDGYATVVFDAGGAVEFQITPAGAGKDTFYIWYAGEGSEPDPKPEPEPEPAPEPEQGKFPAPAGQPEEGYTTPDTILSGTSSEPMSDEDVQSYFRIPAMVTLENGWIVAASDLRWPNTNDSPNNLDTIVSVSKDGGETWEWEAVNYFADFAPIQDPTYWSNGAKSKTDSASFIDPALTVDSSGKLWMAVDLQPPNVNLKANAQKAGSGFDENGWLMVGNITESQYGGIVKGTDGLTAETGKTFADAHYLYRVDFKDATATAEKTGESVDLFPIFHRDGKEMETGYYVDAFFDIWYDYGAESPDIRPVLCQQKESEHYVQSNLFYLASEWKAYSTSYLMIRSAEVVGDKLVWSDPMLINAGIKLDNERFLVFCPGRGFTATLPNGGERILFQLYDNWTGEGKGGRASTVYSDDGGVTWQRGERTENLGEADSASESQVVRLPNGDLRMYSRNVSNGYIGYADSSDNGLTWGAYKLDKSLAYCNNCMVSFINLEGCLVGPDNTVYENLLLASYPRNNYRSDGVIRIGAVGTDEGQSVTWLNKDTVRFKGRYNYSCLTQLPGTEGFAVLYEQDTQLSPTKGVMAMNFVKLTPADLLGSGWVLTAEKPTVPVTLTVDTAMIDLDYNGSKTVTPEYSPADARVAWASTDESVATVADGVITAAGAGTATITLSVTYGPLTRTAAIEVLVQPEGGLTLPEEFKSVLTSTTIPGTTRYVLDEDGVEESKPYIVYALSGERVMHNNTNKNATDHCRPTMDGEQMIANHAADSWSPTDDLWRLEEQEDGAFAFKSITNGKYLTAVANGSQLALGDDAVPYTVTHQGNGVYHVGNGGKYLAFSGGWKMQPEPFEIRLYGELVTAETTTYSVTADGLKVLIRALKEYEANFTDVLALAGTYDSEEEALAAQAGIDEASKTLYAQYRTGNTERYMVTYVVNDVIWGVQSCYAGSTIVPMTHPAAPSGQVFVGWTNLPEDRIMPSHDLTLTASFRSAGGGGVIYVSPSSKKDAPRLPFTDVAEGVWYAAAIANIVDGGVMEGVDAQRFAPGGAMTRGMTAQALYCLAGKPETAGQASFLDLAGGVSYADAVAWGADKGVIEGYSGGMFGGEDALSREQLATLLYRYARLVDKRDATADTGVLEQFADSAEVSGWSAQAMAWLVSNKLIVGRTDNCLAPKATVTRAEAAVILDRYLTLQPA